MFRTLLISTACVALAACGGQNKTNPAAASVAENGTAVAPAPKASASTDLFSIENAYVRLPLDGKTTTAAYFSITALSDAPASILSVTTPDAGSAELHTHILDGAKMSMKRVDFIDIPIGGTAELRPMSDHVMLFETREGLQAGDIVRLEVTLLSNGEPVVMTIEAPVKGLG